MSRKIIFFTAKKVTPDVFVINTLSILIGCHLFDLTDYKNNTSVTIPITQGDRCMTPEKVLTMAKENGAKVVDLRFLDFPGVWQHFTVPISELNESAFEDGFGFDGSSIRGWQPIDASDMLVIPDPTSAKMVIPDPAPWHTHISIWSLLKEHRTAIRPISAPNLSFLSLMMYGFSSNHAFYELDSIEGIWNCGRPNLGSERNFPVPPMDKFHDLRTEMLLVLESLGIDWNVSIMKWPPEARVKLICGLNRFFRWVISSCGSNTCLKMWPIAATTPSHSCPNRYLRITDPACTPISVSGRTGSPCLPGKSMRAFPKPPCMPSAAS